MTNLDDVRQWRQLSSQPDVYSWSVRHNSFFDLRMVAFRLRDGSLAIYSPVSSADGECFAGLAKLGPVSALIAPNHFHNLGLKPFLEHFPAARLLAAQAAMPRLTKVCGLNFSSVATLAPQLPAGLRLEEPAGLKTGELWVLVEGQGAGPLLIECDCFFNMPRRKLTVFGLVLRLTGGAPGLRISRVFRLIAQGNRQTYKSWAEACLRKAAPRVLVPCHGDILVSPTLSDDLLRLI